MDTDLDRAYGHGPKGAETDASSRLPGFYELPIRERQRIVRFFGKLNRTEAQALASFGSITAELCDVFIENAIGSFTLPLGIATNFRVNGRDILVPMAVEETSVLAAASHGAKLARAGGGFRTVSSDPIMTGQIQVFIDSRYDFNTVLDRHKFALISYANHGLDRLLERGGGVKDITWNYIQEIGSLVIHIHVHVCDAMGANIVNTIAEKMSAMIVELFPCEIGLRILTNLSDRRIARAECDIPKSAFSASDDRGEKVVHRIVEAFRFADHDVYRATTNNKGIMNGIDPVVIATGNDWRAIEAGAHAYTCKEGRYRPMARWSRTDAGDLHGVLEMPMAVGTVGGVTKLHPTAKASLKLMGQPNSKELSEIICAVGLAQNLSALRALAAEGIQRGHMHLHQRNLELLERQEGASH